MTVLRRAWLVLLTVYLASISITANQFKVPPVLNTILADLHLTLTQGGWLMSIFSVASIVLAIPAVLINKRYGPKISGAIALSCVLVGSLAGSFVQSSQAFLFTRMLEGVGLGLMAVIAPAVIAAWFPAEKRGFPMGLWASWVPVGFFISYNLAIPLSGRFGWPALWWLGAALSLLALVLFVLVVDNPCMVNAPEQNKKPEDFSGLKSGLLTPEPWLLGLGFAGLGFANIGFLTFAPQYYTQHHGLEAGLANFYVSIPFMVSIFSNPFSGWLITKLPNPKLAHILSIGLIVILFSQVYFLPSEKWIVPWAVALGLLLGFFATGNFTYASSAISSPRQSALNISLGLGINNLVYHTGCLLGPPALGSIISGNRWTLGVWPAVAATLISAIACVLFTVKSSRRERELKPEKLDSLDY